jgi:hypothetical protein
MFRRVMLSPPPALQQEAAGFSKMLEMQSKYIVSDHERL